MFNKFEIITFGTFICFMAVAIYLIQLQDLGVSEQQTAAVVNFDLPVLRVVDENRNSFQSANETEIKTQTMKIQDIKIGVDAEAKQGDKVSVHYIGKLQDGTEFDNSHKRGAPIEFTIGASEVIPGWEEGIVGMQVGGERTLVIPPEKAYGERGIGPIPPNATLVFTVELIEIK